MHRHHTPLSFPLPAVHVDPLPLLDQEFDADTLEALESEPVATHSHPTPEISWEDIEDLAA